MRADNIFNLGIKELWSLFRDPMMMAFIAFAFTIEIYTAATVVPETLNKAPVSFADEDRSPLSERIINGFYAPYFHSPTMVTPSEMDARMDAGLDTFALNIPPNFQRDVLAGRSPAIQINVDATRISQGFTGSNYVQTIVSGEIQEFAQRYRGGTAWPVELAERVRFNPQLNKSWFGAVMKLIDQITMLAIVLTGAALIRERERGTIEHLLVMPVTPFEIMTSKVWAMALVVIVASVFSLVVVIQGLMSVPISGSVPLFLVGVTMHLFATTSMGILLGTLGRSMPQFGLLVMLIQVPLEMLSGSLTPRESMPNWIQNVMLVAPNTHFVMLAQGILFRGAGLEIIWPQLLALAFIGATFFGVALARFRKTIGQMA
jgi:ABC-2 type transport system permease protein